jgi:thiol-disulfide isomerase/thioredoxin
MDLGHFLRGRAALISFWATWCEACLTEMPALNRLSAEALAEGDAVVVGVAIGESQGTVADFVRVHHLRFAQLVDEDFRFTDAVGERRVPTTLVVDRARGIVFRGGALDSESLDAFRRVAAAK